MAEDVVQEVMTTLWTHSERFDPSRLVARRMAAVDLGADVSDDGSAAASCPGPRCWLLN